MNSRLEMLCSLLGENVRAHRKKSEISQEELAFQAELDRTYISQIERGIGNPSLLVLFMLATVLDLRVIDLFEEAPAKKQKC
jgi:transcriptional regulator with XRE-family HTH domain